MAIEKKIKLARDAVAKEVDRAIADLRQSETNLSERELRYRGLFESAQDGLIILDADSGKILEVNQFMIDLLGYSRKNFLEKHLWEIGVFKNIAASKAGFLELKSSNYIRYDGLPLVTKSGKKIEAEFVSYQYNVGDKKVIQCNIRDDTMRKRAEMEKEIVVSNLKERVKELNTIYSIAFLIEIPDIPLDGMLKQIVKVIPSGWKYPDIACARITLDNKVYKTVNFRQTKWRMSSEITINEKLAGSIEVFYLEEKAKADEGPFLKQERSLIDTIAERLGHVAERKKADAQIRVMAEKLRVGNEEFAASNEELRATNEEMEASNAELQATNSELQTSTAALQTSGTKQTASELRYRNLLMHLDAGIVVHAPDTSVIMSNPRASELLGLSEGQIKGKLAIDSQWKFIDWKNNALPLKEYPVNQIAATRKPIKNQLLGINRPVTHDIVWVMVNGFPLFDKKGQITEIIISFIDVTARKLAEKELSAKSEKLRLRNEESAAMNEELRATNEEMEATNEEMEAANEELKATTEELGKSEKVLNASELRYRRLFEAAQDGIFILDYDSGMIVDVNPFLINLLGYSKKNILKKHLWELGVFKNIAASKKGFLKLKSRNFIRYEGRPLVARSGKTIDVEFVSNVYLVGGKKVIQCNIRDITERKIIEDMLKKTEERYAATNAAVDDGLWDWNVKTGNAFFSPIYYRILGYGNNEFTANYAEWRKLVHSDDIGRVELILQNSVKSGKRFEIDLRMKMKSGAWKWVSTRGRAIEKDAKGAAIRMVGTLTDIGIRKKLEESLSAQAKIISASEEKYRSLFVHMVEGFALHEFVYDKKGKPVDYKFLAVNSEFEKLTGMKEKDVVGKTSKQVLPNLEKSWLENYKKVAFTGKPMRFENYSKELGKYYDVTAYSPKKGQFANTFFDITERKKAEEQLRLSGLYTRSLIEASLDPLVTISPEGKITDVNKATEKATGIARKNLMGTDFSKYFTEPKLAAEGYKEVLSKGFVNDYPLTLKHKSGSRTDVLYNSVLYKNESGKVIGIFAAARDITKRKRIEIELHKNSEKLQISNEKFTAINEELRATNEELRATNEEMEATNEELKATTEELGKSEKNSRQLSIKNSLILNSAGEGIYGTDPEGKITFVNPAAAKMLGWGVSELIGTISHSVFHSHKVDGSIYPRKECPLFAVYSKGSIIRKGDKEIFFRKDGTSFPVEFMSSSIVEKGKILGAVVTFSDITTRKMAEESLLESEEKFSTIFKNSPDAVIIARAKDGKIIDVNDAFTSISGFTRKEALSNSSISLNLWANIKDREDVLLSLKTGREVKGGEYQFKIKNGNIIIGLFSSQIIHIGGEPLILSSISDITVRKKAEDTIKQEQTLTNSIIDSIPGTFYMLDEKGCYVRWNSYQRDEIVGKPENKMSGTPAIGTIHPDDRALVGSRIANVLKNGKDEVVEGRVLLRGGPSFRWLLMTGSRMIVNGRPFLVGSGIDITERKQTEEALLQSEALFKESQKAAFVGSYNVDFVKGMWVSSEVLDQIFGVGKNYIRSVSGWLDIVHSADKEMMSKYLSEEIISKRKPFNKEYRISRKSDGLTRWVLGLGQTTKDSKGNVISMTGTIQDITERKRMADEINHENSIILLNQQISSEANMARDASTALKSSIGRICKYTGWPVGHVYLFDNAKGDMLPSGIWHMENVLKFRNFKQITMRKRFARGEGLPGEVLATGKLVWIEDVTSYSNFPRAHMGKKINIRGAFGFPVIVGKNVVAVLEFFTDVAIKRDNQLIQVIETISTQISRVIERKNAEDEIAKNEKRYHLLFETARDSILILHDGIIVGCNSISLQIYGCKDTGRIIGRTPVDFSPKLQPDGAISSVKAKKYIDLAFKGKSQRFYWRHMRADGSEFDVDVSLTPFEQEGKKYLQAIVRDITESKLAEEKIKFNMAEKIQLYRKNDIILKTAQDGFWENDAAGIITYVNSAYCSMSGYKKAEIIGRHISFLAVNEPPKETKQHMKEIISGKKTFFESLHKKKDGTIYPVEISVKYTSDFGGRFFVFIKDISERKEFENSLKDFNAKLKKQVDERTKQLLAEKEKVEEISKVKDNVIRDVSHELKTPLSVIIGNIELLKMPQIRENPETRDQIFGMLERNSGRLKSSIDQILDASRITTMNVLKGEFLLDNIIADIVDEHMPLATNKGLKFTSNCKGVNLEGDPHLIGLAIKNLISNAIKFTASGNVGISAWQDDNFAHIMVSDTGVGMSKKEKTSLFNRFFRVDNKGSGSGIGLVTANEIIIKHNGKITVETKKGKGTTFTITLPRRQ